MNTRQKIDMLSKWYKQDAAARGEDVDALCRQIDENVVWTNPPQGVEMEWMRPLRLEDVEPTAEQIKMADQWMRRGPECGSELFDVDGDILVNNLGVRWDVNGRSDLTAIWIGLDENGVQILVPCSREEALEAAGWKDTVSREQWTALNMEEFWQVRREDDYGNVEMETYDYQRWHEYNDDIHHVKKSHGFQQMKTMVRPVNAVGDFCGWPE